MRQESNSLSMTIATTTPATGLLCENRKTPDCARAAWPFTLERVKAALENA
jgi:hypothetical protein